jgi:hypothetical protein
LAVALVALGMLVGSGLVLAWAQGHTHDHGKDHHDHAAGWLVRLGPDARIEAIERQLRGFETTMAEVAYRYTELYWAGMDGNWEYALHMLEGMKTALATGLERRPEHRKSADTLFLRTALPSMEEAVKRESAELFKQRIEALRAACTACHAAEKHAFIKIGIPTVRRNPVVN